MVGNSDTVFGYEETLKKKQMNDLEMSIFRFTGIKGDRVFHSVKQIPYLNTKKLKQ